MLDTGSDTRCTSNETSVSVGIQRRATFYHGLSVTGRFLVSGHRYEGGEEFKSIANLKAQHTSLLIYENMTYQYSCARSTTLCLGDEKKTRTETALALLELDKPI